MNILSDIITHLNQYAQIAENVQILHRYQKIAGILCVYFAGLILNMSENIETRINFNIKLRS